MTENIHKTEGLNRRSVVKAAAWAAPVVAVAVAAPMAAASAAQASVQTYGQASANPSNVSNGGTATVTFDPGATGMRINGITGAPWDAGIFAAELAVANRFNITAVRINGTVVTGTGGSFVSSSGQVWTVSQLDLANGIFNIQTVSPVTIDAAQGASQNFTMPTIEFDGTYTGSAVNSGRVVLSFSAENVSGGALPGVTFGGV